MNRSAYRKMAGSRRTGGAPVWNVTGTPLGIVDKDEEIGIGNCRRGEAI